MRETNDLFIVNIVILLKLKKFVVQNVRLQVHSGLKTGTNANVTEGRATGISHDVWKINREVCARHTEGIFDLHIAEVRSFPYLPVTSKLR